MATERTPEEILYASSVYGNDFVAREPETLEDYDDEEEDYDSESCDCDGCICDDEDELVECSDCDGSGEVNQDHCYTCECMGECPTCGGEGTL